MATDIKKCEHPACNCMAQRDDSYCSSYCRDAKGTTEISCNCGHSGCSLEEGGGATRTTGD